MQEILRLFSLQNSEGKYFHARGYGGCGKTWVDTLDKARVWAKIGPAKAQSTFFAKKYPEYPLLTIVVLKVTEIELLDESGRVNKILDKEKIRKAKAMADTNRRKLERAKEEFEKAHKKLKELGL